MLYPRGARQPGVCRPCALSNSGLRGGAGGAPPISKRDYKKRKKALAEVEEVVSNEPVFEFFDEHIAEVPMVDRRSDPDRRESKRGKRRKKRRKDDVIETPAATEDNEDLLFVVKGPVGEEAAIADAAPSDPADARSLTESGDPVDDTLSGHRSSDDRAETPAAHDQPPAPAPPPPPAPTASDAVTHPGSSTPPIAKPSKPTATELLAKLKQSQSIAAAAPPPQAPRPAAPEPAIPTAPAAPTDLDVDPFTGQAVSADLTASDPFAAADPFATDTSTDPFGQAGTPTTAPTPEPAAPLFQTAPAPAPPVQAPAAQTPPLPAPPPPSPVPEAPAHQPFAPDESFDAPVSLDAIPFDEPEPLIERRSIPQPTGSFGEAPPIQFIPDPNPIGQAPPAAPSTAPQPTPAPPAPAAAPAPLVAPAALAAPAPAATPPMDQTPMPDRRTKPTTERRAGAADTDAAGAWIPPALRGMASKEEQAATPLPKRRSTD